MINDQRTRKKYFINRELFSIIIGITLYLYDNSNRKLIIWLNLDNASEVTYYAMTPASVAVIRFAKVPTKTALTPNSAMRGR